MHVIVLYKRQNLKRKLRYRKRYTIPDHHFLMKSSFIVIDSGVARLFAMPGTGWATHPHMDIIFDHER